jgi:hypothetical protein
MLLSTLCPSHVGSANGDESYTNTTEGYLLANECSEEKHASGSDE